MQFDWWTEFVGISIVQCSAKNYEKNYEKRKRRVKKWGALTKMLLKLYRQRQLNDVQIRSLARMARAQVIGKVGSFPCSLGKPK